MKHENVIKHFKFHDKSLIMELAENGNLQHFLDQQRQPIKWPLRMKWAMQLTNGLVYLHKNGLIHRDLRCVNILVSTPIHSSCLLLLTSHFIVNKRMGCENIR